jgi:hypothetical protein
MLKRFSAICHTSAFCIFPPIGRYLLFSCSGVKAALGPFPNDATSISHQFHSKMFLGSQLFPSIEPVIWPSFEATLYLMLPDCL